MFTLAIDLGSTGFKASLFSKDLREVASATCALEYLTTSPKCELSVEHIQKTFLQIINGVCKNANISKQDISSVGVSSQAQTYIVVNEQYKPLTNFISWLDTRSTNTIIDILNTKKFDDFQNHCSFFNIETGLQLATLADLQKTNPEYFTDNFKIIPLPSYLFFLLTGKFATDNNIASMNGLFSLSQNQYWETALDYLNLKQHNLPKVYNLGAEVAKTKQGNIFSLTKDIPVFSCGNDQTAGAYGADLKQNQILITLGTAQVAYICTPTMQNAHKDIIRGNYVDGLFYALTADNGGAVISELIRNNPQYIDFATFTDYADRASVDLPSDSLENKAYDCLFELSTKLANNIKLLSQNTTETPQLFLTGGGSKNRVWVKILNNKLRQGFTMLETSPLSGVAKMILNYNER